MTATIGTSTVATATAYGNQRKEDRASNGTLVALFVAQSNELILKYSTDNGATWTVFWDGGYSTNYLANGSIKFDEDDNLHFAFRNATDGYLYYQRGTPTNTARTAYTWSTPVSVSGSSTNLDYPDLVAFRDPAGSGGWWAHIVMSSGSGVNASQRAYYSQVKITSAGTITVPTSASPISNVYNSGTNPSYPSIDFRHTGDGKTVASSQPDLFVGWSAGTTGSGYGIRFMKATYSSGSWTWGTEREIDNTTYLVAGGYWLNTIFDGTRVILAGYFCTSSSERLAIYERDAADTTTTVRYNNGSPGTTDTQLSGSASYDSAGNVYLFGRDASGGDGTQKLRSRRWVRSTAAIDASVVIDTASSNNPYVSARRGSAGSRIDYVYTKGTASPYSVIAGSIVLNTAPNAATLGNPATSSTIDRTVAQTFTWTFSDPDAGDTQSSADLRYRVSGTSTWTTLVGAASTASSYVFAANTFTNGATYEWQVATYDAAGVVGPWSASSTFTAATPPSTPSITAPASGSTVSSAVANVTWSTPNQSAYQVRTVADDGSGNPVTTSVVTDSGTVTDASARTRSCAFGTNNVTQHIQVRVQYQGLWSGWADVKVIVSYTPPATPTITLTPVNLTGSLSIAIVNPTPTSGQPTVSSHDIYINDGLGLGLQRRVTNLAPGATWPYWPARSGWDYAGGNVQVVAIAANGTTSTVAS